MRNIKDSRNQHENTVLTLSVLQPRFAICRLDPKMDIPTWATSAPFFSMTRTEDELSILCPESHVPSGILCEGDWRAFKFEGPFDFGLTGILVAILNPLNQAGVPVLAVATYDTDYVFIKEPVFEVALSVLSAEGHRIVFPHEVSS